jgi:hypothetical protein
MDVKESLFAQTAGHLFKIQSRKRTYAQSCSAASPLSHLLTLYKSWRFVYIMTHSLPAHSFSFLGMSIQCTDILMTVIWVFHLLPPVTRRGVGYWNAKYKSSAEKLFEFWMNQSKGLVPGLSMHCLQICCFQWLLRQLLAWHALLFTAIKFRSFLLSLHEHVFIHICFIPSY